MLPLWTAPISITKPIHLLKLTATWPPPPFMLKAGTSVAEFARLYVYPKKVSNRGVSCAAAVKAHRKTTAMIDRLFLILTLSFKQTSGYTPGALVGPAISAKVSFRPLRAG